MNSLDYKILTYGILAQEWPWIGGNEYAGTVVSVGPAVENLVAGDRVVAVGVNFIEGQEVSGWQEYALLRADLCTKLADHVPFDKACTVPTAFTSASIAIAIELGLKYPDPPPAPPKKSAASIWESAMAALGNGATFSWDLEEGTIQDGVWLPRPKSSAIQDAPLSPEAIAKKAEADRLRREQEEREAKARQEKDARLHATLSQAFAEKVEKRRSQGPQPSVPRVPGYDTHPHRTKFPDTGPDPWANTHPMPWDTYDMSHEGSVWENSRAYGRFEVVDERHNALGLGLTGLGLDLGPRFGTAGLLSPGSARTDNTSPCGSASASASMGRSGSDDSNTSTSASEVAAMSASYPALPVPNLGPVGRRGSEPSLRAQESLSSWMGVRSAPGPDLMPTVYRSPLLPTQSTNLVAVRPHSSCSVLSKACSPVPRARGTTSPFRVPATLTGRGRGRGSPPYRVREQSPLGHRPSSSLEIGVKIDPTWSDRHDPSTQFSINGATTRIPPSHPTLSATFPNHSSERASKPDSWSLSAGGGVPNTFFPAPLSRTENPAYVMDEPILVWGGATCVGRAALQLLKRAGYTNLLVVAAYERHVELAEITPANTKFFDYRDANIVDEIRTSIGVQKLNKVLDTVAMPYTLEPISQLVTSGAKVAALLPVNTPMPDGVEVKPVMFGRCHDYTGKDVLSFNFGKETMWPLLGELLRKGEWAYPPAVHLSGGLRACATDAMRMMSSRDNAGKRLVFEVSSN